MRRSLRAWGLSWGTTMFTFVASTRAEPPREKTRSLASSARSRTASPSESRALAMLDPRLREPGRGAEKLGTLVVKEARVPLRKDPARSPPVVVAQVPLASASALSASQRGQAPRERYGKLEPAVFAHPWPSTVMPQPLRGFGLPMALVMSAVGAASVALGMVFKVRGLPVRVASAPRAVLDRPPSASAAPGAWALPFGMLPTTSSALSAGAVLLVPPPLRRGPAPCAPLVLGSVPPVTGAGIVLRGRW